MIDIEENSTNHEIVSVLVIAVGMLCLMINEKISILLILAGSGSLALLYGYRFVAKSKVSNGKLHLRLIYRLNYFILLLSIGMMAWLILSGERKTAWLIAGIAVLALLLIVNLLFCRMAYFRKSLIAYSARIALFLILILLFYFFR
jgi:hypothetical protein